MLCRRHGATAAYTPMLHARLFDEAPAYREEHFTTCPGDRPLLAQFCGHDPATVLGAAARVAARVDAVDLNLGCPQRIARKGRYGAFLMDDPATVTAIIAALARGLPVPVTAKMRVFPDVDRTVAFAKALEGAGASLVAVHGRTREQKEASAHAADWAQIAAVKAALRVPVLANGGVLTLADAEACMAATGADGVLSAIPLLENPALFSATRPPAADADPAAGALLALEYAELVALHPTPPRMVRGHAHRLMGPWLAEFTDLRDALGAGGLDGPALEAIAGECVGRIRACERGGRTTPIPALSARALARLAKEEAIAGAVAEAAREEAALAAIGVVGEEALVERSAACV
jgi:tRNA-dihydrouridine synthase 1